MKILIVATCLPFSFSHFHSLSNLFIFSYILIRDYSRYHKLGMLRNSTTRRLTFA